MKVYFATDHGGFALKNALVGYVRGLGYDAEDCGAHTLDPEDDYPPIIARAIKKLIADLAAGKESRAVILGRSGQGEAMVANRFPGVRAAVYYGYLPSTVIQARDHNDANVLSLGADALASHDEARRAVKQFVETPFSGEERHVRRNAIIDDDFSQWNGLKRRVHGIDAIRFHYAERDIFYALVGRNIGREQNGARENFARPVLVIRKFNRDSFLGVPLTTAVKRDAWYQFVFDLGGVPNAAIVSQLRLWDSRRLLNRIGAMDSASFNTLNKKLRELFTSGVS